MADSSSGEQVVEEVTEKENGFQKKIDTAVKFLQNPRVKETPLSQRKAFLAKKGLSPEEISLAIKQSGTSEQKIESEFSPSRVPSYQNEVIATGQAVPFSIRWRDYFMIAVIAGGFGYTLTHLVKTYVLPYFLEHKDGSEDKIEQLHSSVSELKENLSQTVGGIQDTLDSVQKLLKDQQQKVQSLSLALSTSQSSLSQSLTDTYSLSEVKSELSSLKGLLLSSRQFPSPVVQSSPLPSIPSWQRNDVNIPKMTSDTVKNTNILSNMNDDLSTSSANGVETAASDDEASDTSSGTLESHGPQGTRGGVNDNEGYSPDLSDASLSTISSDLGSPNLSLNEAKENLSGTFIKVTKD